MQPQPVNSGLPAISAAHASAAAPLSSAPSAPATPGISQQPSHRWKDLPVDVVEPVMYWSMLQSGSSLSATSFALTSKHLAQAGQSFRSSSWHQEARSLMMHERTVNWTCTFVKFVGYLKLRLTPRDLGELNLALKIMARSDEGMLHALNIEHQQHAEPGTDYLDGFRKFRGKALSLLTGVLERTRDQIVEISRALPANVCLYVELSDQVFRLRMKDLGVASLVRLVAMSGRPTAFNLKRSEDLSIRPDELGALLDVACGPGMVSFLHFGRMEDPDAMLDALRDRCHRFRDLKLVIFDCERVPTRDSLLALVAAMEKRNSAARSRLIVVIDCIEVRAGSTNAASLFSAGELAAYEHAGLYFESLESGMNDDQPQQKVLASLMGVAAHGSLPQPLTVDGDPSTVSHVPFDASDSDDWPDSSGDDAQAGQAGRQLPAPAPQPRRTVQGPAPRVAKRDFCAIS